MPARLRCVAAVFLLGLTLLACGESEDDDSAAKPGADRAAAAVPDPLRIGTDPTYPPLEFLDGNELTGAEVEIMKAMAELLGTTPQFVRGGFATLIPGLYAKRIDAIAAGMYDSLEAREPMTYVEYLGLPGFGGLFRAGEAPPDARVEHLCGKTLAVGKGTGVDKNVGELTKGCSPKAKVLVMPDEAAAQLAVESGRAYAFFTGYMSVSEIARKAGAGKKFKAVKYPTPKQTANKLISVAVREADGKLAREIQRALQTLIDDGRYRKILRKYGIEFMARDKVLVNRKP